MGEHLVEARARQKSDDLAANTERDEWDLRTENTDEAQALLVGGTREEVFQGFGGGLGTLPEGVSQCFLPPEVEPSRLPRFPTRRIDEVVVEGVAVRTQQDIDLIATKTSTLMDREAPGLDQGLIEDLNEYYSLASDGALGVWEAFLEELEAGELEDLLGGEPHHVKEVFSGLESAMEGAIDQQMMRSMQESLVGELAELGSNIQALTSKVKLVEVDHLQLQLGREKEKKHRDLNAQEKKVKRVASFLIGVGAGIATSPLTGLSRVASATSGGTTELKAWLVGTVVDSNERVVALREEIEELDGQLRGLEDEEILHRFEAADAELEGVLARESRLEAAIVELETGIDLGFDRHLLNTSKCVASVRSGLGIGQEESLASLASFERTQGLLLDLQLVRGRLLPKMDAYMTHLVGEALPLQISESAGAAISHRKRVVDALSSCRWSVDQEGEFSANALMDHAEKEKHTHLREVAASLEEWISLAPGLGDWHSQRLEELGTYRRSIVRFEAEQGVVELQRAMGRELSAISVKLTRGV